MKIDHLDLEKWDGTKRTIGTAPRWVTEFKKLWPKGMDVTPDNIAKLRDITSQWPLNFEDCIILPEVFECIVHRGNCTSLAYRQWKSILEDDLNFDNTYKELLGLWVTDILTRNEWDIATDRLKEQKIVYGMELLYAYMDTMDMVEEEVSK